MATSAASLFTRGGSVLLFSNVTARGCKTVAAVRTYSQSCLQSPGLPNFSSLTLRGVRRLCCLPLSSEQTAVTDAVPSLETGPPPTSADGVPSPQEQESAVRASAGLLDIRVGRVLRAWLHPEADSLYVEEVDVGEPEPRTICSGLVKYVPLDQLQGKNVVVLANLKPRNMRGVKSNGMLMAASDDAHENVELLLPPDGSVPGERLWFGSEEDKDGQPEAATPNQVQKKKIWETVQPHLKTTESYEAVLLGAYPMRTSVGVVTCSSLKKGNIS